MCSVHQPMDDGSSERRRDNVGIEAGAGGKQSIEGYVFVWPFADC